MVEILLWAIIVILAFSTVMWIVTPAKAQHVNLHVSSDGDKTETEVSEDGRTIKIHVVTKTDGRGT